MPQKPGVRSWGTRFDTLPSSEPASPQSPGLSLDQSHAQVVNQHVNNAFDASGHTTQEKLPHDASVFVGSLPTNIDQVQLCRLLTEHLSPYAEVKIKIVRDSKGGFCAFVQCKSAEAASNLITTLNSSVPVPFLGRILRYEPARAFRTLLISYCIPTERLVTADGKTQVRALEPCFAMRLWKPKNSSRLSIIYNKDAVDVEESAVISREPIGDLGLFLNPVVLDEASLEQICSFFGPLESLTEVGVERQIQGVNATAPEHTSYPSPHNGPRLPQMDQRCFEIKWRLRDDCVNALMNLRHVPHMRVTWAHQPPTSADAYIHGLQPNGRFQQTAFSFHPHLSASHLHQRSQTHTSPAAHRPRNLSLNSNGEANAPVDGWNKISVSESATSFNQSSAFDSEAGNITSSWPEGDFPPLGNTGASRRRDEVWVDKKMDGTVSSVIAEDGDAGARDVNGQEIEVPGTPGLGMSPTTPKTVGSQFPTTPTSTSGELQGSFPTYDHKGRDGYFGAPAEPKEIDPTTLFIGGLEMHGPDSWDERKVQSYFGRFPGLVDVKLVRPANARAAFAFIKFDNTDSPARAVFEEHNSVHAGRAMRVQLRDCNPPRAVGWKYNPSNRGRGGNRFGSQNHHVHRRFQDRPEQAHELDLCKDMSRMSVQEHQGSMEPDFADENVDQTQSCPVSRQVSPAPAAETPEYREWYDTPASATLTPPPSTAPSSTSAPSSIAGYPMPPAGFYPPPWVHSFPPQMPYGAPYYPGFSPYMVPAHAHGTAYTSPGGSDASGPASISPQPWPAMNMYGGYIPYPTYPVVQPPVEKTTPSPAAAATEYTQNEHAPVYSPEAYMHDGPPGFVPPTWPHPMMAQRYGPWMQPNGHLPPAPAPPHIQDTGRRQTGRRDNVQPIMNASRSGAGRAMNRRGGLHMSGFHGQQRATHFTGTQAF
ncbi:unnamed protein product [Mycena citricolor]|uniref:RRM domain-containing protein n=1 Tax=Mycena citricolor TaxID=2018698 RepID=A0AAD2K5T9_9AGAR|nr:unnamed protein product [Mycena citricolor]